MLAQFTGYQKRGQGYFWSRKHHLVGKDNRGDDCDTEMLGAGEMMRPWKGDVGESPGSHWSGFLPHLCFSNTDLLCNEHLPACLPLLVDWEFLKGKNALFITGFPAQLARHIRAVQWIVSMIIIWLSRVVLSWMHGWHTVDNIMLCSEGSRENDGKLIERNGFDSLGEFISRRREVTAPKGRRNVICEAHNSWPSLVPLLKGSHGKVWKEE